MSSLPPIASGDSGPGSSERPFDSVRVPPELPEGWRLDTAQGDQVAEAEAMEYEVFAAIGYCEESPLGRAREFDPWRERSEFKVVRDADGVLRGVVHVLVGRYEDLPIGTFERYREYPPDPLLEYASLAVPVGERNRGVAEALYRGVWQEAIRLNTSGMVAIAADWLLRILNGAYDLGFESLGPKRFYMGSECVPIGTDLIGLIHRLKRQPSFFRWAVAEIDLRNLTSEPVRAAVTAARSE